MVDEGTLMSADESVVLHQPFEIRILPQGFEQQADPAIAKIAA